eukprot:1148755-Prorocentrum_minimum.AAC.1
MGIIRKEGGGDTGADSQPQGKTVSIQVGFLQFGSGARADVLAASVNGRRQGSTRTYGARN